MILLSEYQSASIPGQDFLNPLSTRTAVRFKNSELTYGDLEDQSNRLARHLHHLGVTPKDRVAIALERSLHVPVAVRAVLKTGAAYVPLDPRYPSQRLSFMLRDCEPRVLLTTTSLVGRLDFNAQTTLLLDQEPSQDFSDFPLPNESQAEGPAYIIYTSGSTGEPKGVALGRPALANLIAWQCRASRAGPDWRTLQFTPLSFDVHFQEFFSTWASGGSLVLIDEETRLDPAKLLATIEQEQISRLFVPFLALQSLAEVACRRRHFPACLREVITAGEQLQITVALRSFFTQLKNCSLHNHYGPSETHVVTAHQLPEDPATWPILPPIGAPLPGVELRVIEENGTSVGLEQPGELYISGVPLADGYFNRPNLTAERFPILGGRRHYRTGDRVRRRADGNYEFLGRLDSQVKISGHRVELGEIEVRMREHPAVAQCAVVMRGNREEGQRLVGYWVAKPATITTATALREYLHERLPNYMVPSAFVRLEALPQTPSGKLDGKSLPAPTGSRAEWDGEYRAPRNALEGQVAALWADLLGIQCVGISDNFFALGGDSLLAVRHMVRMEETLGYTLPVADLIHAPTIEQLTASLRAEARSATVSSLVSIQPRGANLPFYCVGGGQNNESKMLFGYSSIFVKLAQRLGPDQPFYSFCLAYPKEDNAELLTIEKIAAGFLRDVLSLQPRGPYFLGGWSLGGLVAYEMARQLRTQGEVVELLALFDTTGPGYPRKRPWFQQLRLHCKRLRSFGMLRGPFYILRTLSDLIQSNWMIFRLALGKLLGRTNPWSKVMQIERAYLASYGTYPGPIVLFVGTETLRETVDQVAVSHDPHLGWGALVKSEITTHHIHGGHYTVWEEPGLTELADQLTMNLCKPLTSMSKQTTTSPLP